MADPTSYAQLGTRHWDVVAQFMVFRPEQMQQDIATFSGKTGQYIFISSASVYQHTIDSYVITEKTPPNNPYWRYSQDKIACETLMKAAKGLPWTNVRPSHTVRSGLPTLLNEGDAVGHRLLAGKPLLVAGDGNAPWTLTRSEDFARPFVNLFGKARASARTSTSRRRGLYLGRHLHRDRPRSGGGAQARPCADRNDPAL